jgi:hypothetical protein
MAIKHNILHRDGSKKVFESPAYGGQYIYFSNRGDDIDNNVIGKGEQFSIDNASADTEKYISAQFLEDVQIKDAYIFWENAVWGDSIGVEIELPANTLFPSLLNTGNVDVIDGNITAVTSSQIPDKTWTGSHMYFPIDVSIVRFVNEFPINGTNIMGTVLESKSAALLDKRLKLKLVLKSPSANPKLKVSVVAELYRTDTI